MPGYFSAIALFVGLADLADFGKEPFHILLGGFNSQAFFVSANVLSEKIKSVCDMRDVRLFW